MVRREENTNTDTRDKETPRLCWKGMEEICKQREKGEKREEAQVRYVYLISVVSR